MVLGLTHGFSRLIFGSESGGRIAGEIDLKIDPGGLRLVSRFNLFYVQSMDVDPVATGHIPVFDKECLYGFGRQVGFRQGDLVAAGKDPKDPKNQGDFR